MDILEICRRQLCIRGVHNSNSLNEEHCYMLCGIIGNIKYLTGKIKVILLLWPLTV